ncbi:MAG: hypothetical protein ACKO7W_12570, partial [Elainella sp.]
ILAQKLMFEAEALRQPYGNALYGPWVEDVDIEGLLKLGSEENPNFSILSSNRIADIGYRYVLQRYASGQPTPRQRHLAAAASIRLGMAMSNLNGVDYAVEVIDFPDVMNLGNRSRNMFTYTRHKDHFTCEIRDGAADDSPDLWQTLEKVSRSSGAFPFAFRLLQIERQGKDASYERSVLSPDRTYPFAYTDGGVFENEPLGLAKDLVDQVDKYHLEHDNRFYLYVAPGAKRSAANLQINAADSTYNATYLNTGAALAGAIFTQARFQNWIATSRINQAIRQFEQQAKELSDVLLKSPQLKSALSSVADSLLEVLYSQGTAEEQRQQIMQDRERLRQQFTEEYDRLVYGVNKASSPSGNQGQAVAESWLKLVQALEKVQNLGSKDVMTVYAITSGDVELAGEQLFAFGGFLDQSFRDFDYNVGRRKATLFLQRLQALQKQGSGEGQLYLTNFVAGQNLPSMPADLGQVDLTQVSRQKRYAVKSQLMDRGQLMINSIENRFWVRWLLKLSLRIFLSPKLDRLLKL